MSSTTTVPPPATAAPVLKPASTTPVARPPSDRPQVVVIGGGFAGLEATKKFKGENVDVTLIDRSNHHLFQPLLYQVATAGLTPANIARPLREIFRHQENVEVILSEVRRVDTASRKVITEDLVVPYDFLILATGARHSYFGHDEWEKFAPGLKNLADAVEIRKRLLTAFEVAEKAVDQAERDAAMTFVIVGGGPDWRRNGGSHQRDCPAHDDARFPLHQFRPGEDYHHRGSAAHSLGLPGGAFGQR